MRVLVTGANGLVGKALQQVAPEWSYIARIDCDLARRADTICWFNNFKPDCVVHLASYVPGFYEIDKVKSFQENVRINENVLEATHSSGCKRGLFCLSANMFAGPFPADESMIMQGELSGQFAGYGYAKRMLAHQIQCYNEQFGTQYFGIIPCNVYGPGDDPRFGRLVPSLMQRFKEAKNSVTVNGTGHPMRQFIYSGDLARIIRRLVEEYRETKPMICCADDECSIMYLSTLIADATRFSGEIIFDSSKPDGLLRRTVSNAYMKTVLPGIKFISLADGLRKTMEAQ